MNTSQFSKKISMKYITRDIKLMKSAVIIDLQGEEDANRIIEHLRSLSVGLGEPPSYLINFFMIDSVI